MSLLADGSRAAKAVGHTAISARSSLNPGSYRAAPKKGIKVAFRWVLEGPLHQVPVGYQCDWPFVSTVDELLYIRKTNTVFQDTIMTEDGLSILGLTVWI